MPSSTYPRARTARRRCRSTPRSTCRPRRPHRRSCSRTGSAAASRASTPQAAELAQRGFVVLTYSARGFGRSTGQIALNSLDYEVARRAEAARLARPAATRCSKDGAGRPAGRRHRRLLRRRAVAAARGRRPAGRHARAGHHLQRPEPGAAAELGHRRRSRAATPAANAFADDGVFKRSWAGIFFSAGHDRRATWPAPSATRSSPARTTTRQPARPTPAQPRRDAGQGDAAADAVQPGAVRTLPPEVCAAYTEVATTGRASAQTLDLLRRSSPVDGRRPDHPADDAGAGRAGHAVRARPGRRHRPADQRGRRPGQGRLVRGRPRRRQPRPASCAAQIADWFDFHLRGKGADPGTGFEYAVQGALRTQRHAVGAHGHRAAPTPAWPARPHDRAAHAAGCTAASRSSSTRRAATRPRSAACPASGRRSSAARRGSSAGCRSTCPARRRRFTTDAAGLRSC